MQKKNIKIPLKKIQLYIANIFLKKFHSMIIEFIK